MEAVRAWQEQRDTAARNALILSHLRALVRPARKFGGRWADMEDAIQDAAIGLFKALERFDTSKSGSFSTYASYWVMSAVQHGACARHMMGQGTLTKALSTARKLWDDADHHITPREIVEEAGMDPLAEGAYMGVLSLHDTMPDGEREYIDTITTHDPEPEPVLMSAGEEITLMKDMASLGPGDVAILTGRYGLDGEPHIDQGTMAQKRGVTRQLISLREIKAMRRLLKMEAQRLTATT